MTEFLIKTLAKMILGSDAFNMILVLVREWAAKEISGAEKRAGVLHDIAVIGLKLTESAARLGIELAVTYLKRIA